MLTGLPLPKLSHGWPSQGGISVLVLLDCFMRRFSVCPFLIYCWLVGWLIGWLVFGLNGPLC